jgi:predicted TIM-barrel fold metal-dependent hydrolase
VFGAVLAAHPRLVAVLAHAGLPDYAEALRLVRCYPRVYLDTTMVGVPFTEPFAALPADWPARLVDVADRVVLRDERRTSGRYAVWVVQLDRGVNGFDSER